MIEIDPGCGSHATPQSAGSAWTAIAVLCLMSLFMLVPERAQASADAEERFAVLVFSRTAGFRHDSIPAGIAAIQALGSQHGFDVDATEAPARFSDQGLAKYRVVVFLNTTGAVLDAGQHAAFERLIGRGGGFVGIHSAADTEYDWAWYGKLIGAYFRSHPAIQSARLNIVDRAHVSTRHLPAQWTRIDEWYNFRNAPAADVSVLMRIDETSYEGGSMGGDHPIAWCHTYGGGRAWYTALGHTVASYSDPLFLQHLWGGIAWAAGVRLP
jgi:type 1 glutamine amidotransferase